MTEEQKNELAVWTPAPFEGNDLLPVGSLEPADATGREHVESDDLILPAIKLLQGQSDESLDTDEPDAVPGKLWHTGALDAIDGPVRVLLCAHTRSRALFPKANNPAYNGINKCLSRDAVEGSQYGACEQCPHKEWRSNPNSKDDDPPLCSESHNFTALTALGPAIIRFSRTSFKTARKFLTTWTLSPKPIFAHPTKIAIKADSKEIEGKQTKFYRLELKWLTREDVPPAAQAAARAVYEQVTAAHEEGRFSGEDEDKQFDDVPL